LTSDNTTTQAQYEGWKEKKFYLSDPGATVHPIGPILIKPMPVHRRCIGNLVCDVDQQTIALINSDERAWELTIDNKHCPKHSLRGGEYFEGKYSIRLILLTIRGGLDFAHGKIEYSCSWRCVYIPVHIQNVFLRIPPP
jgi:hypothetical protein